MVRLFCFPYGGSGAMGYRRWAKSLPPGIELVPVQIPGRESRFSEKPYEHAEPLARDLADRLDTGRPYAFFGHSFGALAAFELARELRRRGRPLPEALLLSGLPAPHLARRRPRIAHLSDAEFIATLRDQFDLTDELVANHDLMEMVLPIMRADFAVVENYVCPEEPPFEIPIRVFGGLSDPEVTREELDAWQKHSARPVAVRVFLGGHFFINTNQEFLPALSTALRETLGARIG
ncbi:MAG TPA: alpha/beta fold hydrolase [Thermoanaerobaculia bacterium]|nr:alpha/beta fold hydrolase [Thermoanaerobaculia bacterium]